MPKSGPACDPVAERSPERRQSAHSNTPRPPDVGFPPPAAENVTIAPTVETAMRDRRHLWR